MPPAGSYGAGSSPLPPGAQKRFAVELIEPPLTRVVEVSARVGQMICPALDDETTHWPLRLAVTVPPETYVAVDRLGTWIEHVVVQVAPDETLTIVPFQAKPFPPETTMAEVFTVEPVGKTHVPVRLMVRTEPFDVLPGATVQELPVTIPLMLTVEPALNCPTIVDAVKLKVAKPVAILILDTFTALPIPFRLRRVDCVQSKTGNCASGDATIPSSVPPTRAWLLALKKVEDPDAASIA